MLHCLVADVFLTNQEAYNLQDDPEKYSIACLVLENQLTNQSEPQGQLIEKWGESSFK